LKLLLFSDLHADLRAAEQLVNLAADADIIVGAGDFGNARRDVAACINILRRIRKPAVLVPGNNESQDELIVACQDWPEAVVLHGSGTELRGIPFYGIGGGIPVTPFGPWSWDFTEEQGVSLLANSPRGAVLVSHSPPKGTLDRSSSGRSLGSSAVRDAIIRLRPRLVVCGHIHGSGGQSQTMGVTTVVNAGPAGVPWVL
jgi:uncharacterized protein